VPSGRLQFKTPIWLVMQSALGKDSRISNKAITVLDTFALEICTRLVQVPGFAPPPPPLSLACCPGLRLMPF
jgi:hypothetical protein